MRLTKCTAPGAGRGRPGIRFQHILDRIADGQGTTLLDELIRSIDGARNALLNMEDLGEKELDQIRAEYITLAEEARKTLLEKRTAL